MTLDKHEAEIGAAAVRAFETEADGYREGTESRARLLDAAEALRSILPKPRFYAIGADVCDTASGVVSRVPVFSWYDDAKAHRVAEKWAAALNEEVE